MLAELVGIALAVVVWWRAWRPPPEGWQEARLLAWASRELAALPPEDPPQVGDVLPGSLAPGACRYVVRDGVRYQVFVDGTMRVVSVRGLGEYAEQVRIADAMGRITGST